MTAQSRGWGPPCSGETVPLVVLGASFAPGVDRRVHDIMEALVLDLVEATGETPVDGWCWGMACRKIRGRDSWSNHAWGLAIDFNAPRHPLHASGTMSRVASTIATRWGCRWGGDYSGRKDEMHFEFMGTPADAARLTKIARGRGGDPDMLTNDKRGDDVAQAQELVNAFLKVTGGGVDPIDEDGHWGATSQAAMDHVIGRLQREPFTGIEGVRLGHHVTSTTVGPATLAEMAAVISERG